MGTNLFWVGFCCGGLLTLLIGRLSGECASLIVKFVERHRRKRMYFELESKGYIGEDGNRYICVPSYMPCTECAKCRYGHLEKENAHGGIWRCDCPVEPYDWYNDIREMVECTEFSYREDL